MTAQIVTVILDRVDGAENPYTKGTVTWTPSLEFPDVPDQQLVGMAPVTAEFRAGATAQVKVIANDTAGPQGSGTPGWTWNVTYSSDTPGSPAAASYYVLSTNGLTQRLSALAVVPAAQPGSQYVPLAGNVNMQGPLAPLDTNLTDNAAITVSAGANDYTLHLTSAVGATRTVTLGTGLDGQVMTMLLIQPASGGPCGVTWSGVDWGRALTAPALSSAPNAADLLAWKYKTALSAWRYMGVN